MSSRLPAALILAYQAGPKARAKSTLLAPPQSAAVPFCVTLGRGPALRASARVGARAEPPGVATARRAAEGHWPCGPACEANGAPPSNLDCGSSARTDTQVAEQQPTNGAGRDEGEDRECAGIHQSADHDLDRHSRKKCEDRAEYDGHGDQAYGPDWETDHGATVLRILTSAISTAAVNTPSAPPYPREAETAAGSLCDASRPGFGATSRRGEVTRWISRAIMGAARIANPGVSPMTVAAIQTAQFGRLSMECSPPSNATRRGFARVA